MGQIQFDFRDAMTTREALFGIQVLLKNYKDVNRDVFLAFIDYEKTFDSVRHNKLIEILQTTGIDSVDIRRIRGVYWKSLWKCKNC